jgi:arsenite methyltransferase
MTSRLRRLATIVLFCATLALAQQTRMPPRSQDRPLPDRIAGFERESRDQELKPDQVIAALKLHDGEVVADIGAGTGYFSRRFARAVAPRGKVFAVDVAADGLDYLKQRVAKEGIRNVETIVSKPDDPLLPANAVDLVFFCDTTHHIANRVQYYRTLLRALKPHAQLAIIDFPPGGTRAPHAAEELVSREQATDEAKQAGFRLVQDFRFLPYHYFLLFERQ